jgi:outer membrane biosynthesis protein TonB
MSYDEEEQRRSRVVVETPTARREVVHSQTVRSPERAGFSTGMVAAVALAAIAATAIVFLFLMNRGDANDTNINIRASAQPTPVTQQPVIVQQPPLTQPTPIVIQQPPPITTQPPPVIITQPAPPPVTTTAPPAASTSAPRSTSDDASVQANLDRAFADDEDLKSSDVTAVVVGGKVTLNGMVRTEELKQRAARVAGRLKGVTGVDNKIVVTGG